jgi:hypothetical protein
VVMMLLFVCLLSPSTARRSNCLPAAGIGAVADQLAARLAPGTVALGATVDKVSLFIHAPPPAPCMPWLPQAAAHCAYGFWNQDKQEQLCVSLDCCPQSFDSHTRVWPGTG